MDYVFNIIIYIYIIWFTNSSTGNGIVDIFTINTICASGCYPIFEELYLFWGCPLVNF